MDFLFEIIVEIIIEGSLELGTNRKVPLFFRILALLIFLLIYGALIGLFALIGIGCWQEGNIAAAIVVFILDAIFTVFVVAMIRKKIKEKNNREGLH